MRVNFLAPLIISLLFGCGPIVTSAPNRDLAVSRIALLPPEYPSGVNQDRVNALYSSLLSELTGNGFIVLDPRSVRMVCTTPACNERALLFKDYQVDAVAALTLSSVSSNNFLAGYYNTIKGSLALYDSQAQPLINVENQESERGGLLFNSGQLAQGFISQARGANATEGIQNKFIRSLVSKLPQPKTSDLVAERDMVKLVSVEAQPQRLGLYRVCAKGTPAASAYIKFGRVRSNLREVRPGYYCGVLPISKSRSTTVELRSPFGAATERELAL